VSSWPQVDLEEISDISAGNPAPQNTDHFCVDGYPFVRMQDVGRKHIDPALVETTDRVSPLAVRECGLRLYPAGTLLIPKSGASVNLNHRAMLGQDAYVVSHLATIIPDQRKVLPSYLFHWSQRYDPRSQAQVTSLPSLPLSLIKAAKVPLPPLDEQRRIVGLLDRAAEIRRRADAARAKTRAIIPALFLDMFGDPATNPKGWVVKPLRDHISLIGGGTPAKARPEFWGGSIPWISPKDMRPATISDSGDKITEAAMTSSPVRLVPSDNILIVVRGMILAHTVPIRMNKIAVTLNQDMKALVPDDCLDASFLRWLLQSAHDYFLGKVRESAHGTKKLETAILTAFPTMLPPLPLQTAFAEQAQRLEAAAGALDAAVAKAEAMAAALSAEVFD
jgi:type I restriction enzyme S subunit